MKKKLFILYFLLSELLFAQTFDSIIKNNNYEVLIHVISKNNSYLADFYFSDNTKSPQIGFEGSGFNTLASFYNEDDNNLYAKVLYLWEGAEVIDENDYRELTVENIVINKKYIENKIKTNSSDFKFIEYHLDYDSLIFKASDIIGSIKNEYNFYVKSKEDLFYQPSKKSEKILRLDKSKKIKILDVSLDKENKEDVWLKIDVDGTVGYIPLSSLADDWKVVKNDLNKYLDVAHIQAFCNDNRVRIRTEPNLNCETLGYLNKGDKVYIKSNSEKKQTIDNESWYWNQVELPEGTTGWVYGKYLDIEK